ncbi:MAG TPA: response regulator, partial [Nitrospirota bacterium]
VIMDLTIPGGMGGQETIKKLIEIDPGARVIVASGYSNDPIMADFVSYGFSGVLAKPFTAEMLAAVLRECLE